MDKPHVVGLSFGGALAIEFCRRYPAVPSTLTLVGAYAGWAGSLPPETAEQRLRQALELSELSPDEFVDTLLPTMFAARVSPHAVDALRAGDAHVSPRWFPGHGAAAAEDLRAALPSIDVPTLLIYGADDIRAPMAVADRPAPRHSGLDPGPVARCRSRLQHRAPDGSTRPFANSCRDRRDE